MKLFYSWRTCVLMLFIIPFTSTAQTPTTTTGGFCQGVIANFNSTDNGFNSPSIYGSVFDSSFYYHAGRGYWTDYLPPYRTEAPGAPRVLNIISPPYTNPNPNGTFNVGFSYVVPNAQNDRFQVRIISVTQTPQGTVTNVEATSGVQAFKNFSTPTPYNDASAGVSDPTPYLVGEKGNVCIRLVDPDIQNNANTTFRVEVSYLVNEPMFAVFDNLSIGPIGAPLPVDFIGLLANRNSDNSVSLKWDVSDEVNVTRYEIEKSVNGGVYSNAGQVTAKGKSIYAFTDADATEGTVFYRVKSVDIDGRAKYSGVVRLKGKAGDSYANQMLVYPSPANDQVTVEHKRITNGARITITGVDGKVVREITPVAGASHTPVNVIGLKPGIYFVKFDEGGGYFQTAKLIKN